MDPIEQQPLVGQVALVTGGGRGIGRTCAVALGAAGATVGVVARTASELQTTVAIAHTNGSVALPFVADVCDRGAMQSVVDSLLQRFDRIDLLVNNAGVATPIGPLWEADPDEWWRSMETNLRGPMLCSRLVLPSMLARKQGRIVNLSSGAATRAGAHLSAYVVGKTALTRLSECLAEECRPHGVSVFALHPGVVRTSMTEDAMTSESGQQWLPWFRTPFDQRLDVSSEIAASVIVTLASGRADALSGRFIDATMDLPSLMEDAHRVQREDLLVLRIRR